MADTLRYRRNWEFPENSIGKINADMREQLAAMATQEAVTEPNIPAQDKSTQGEQ
jgi:hypothetical protein